MVQLDRSRTSAFDFNSGLSRKMTLMRGLSHAACVPAAQSGWREGDGGCSYCEAGSVGQRGYVILKSTSQILPGLSYRG